MAPPGPSVPACPATTSVLASPSSSTARHGACKVRCHVRCHVDRTVRIRPRGKGNRKRAERSTGPRGWSDPLPPSPQQTLHTTPSSAGGERRWRSSIDAKRRRCPTQRRGDLALQVRVGRAGCQPRAQGWNEDAKRHKICVALRSMRRPASFANAPCMRSNRGIGPNFESAHAEGKTCQCYSAMALHCWRYGRHGKTHDRHTLQTRAAHDIWHQGNLS